MVFDIRNYGASTNGSPTQNAKAIQHAIMDASAHNGTVLVAGGDYQTANLQLASNITLKIDENSSLSASTNWQDYTLTDELFSHPSAVEKAAYECNDVYLCGFLWAQNAYNITITGPGRIHGNGSDNDFFPHTDDPFKRRPMLILPLRCHNIRITNIHLSDPAMFTVYCVLCSDVFISGVQITSVKTDNGDGLDFDGTSNVRIENCDLYTGDDAIGLKTHYRSNPCENYSIRDCRIRSEWAGFRIGPESTADFRNINLENCHFTGCNDGFKIQTCSIGIIENIHLHDCTMIDVNRPVFMTISRFRFSCADSSLRPTIGKIRNIHIADIESQTGHGNAPYQHACFVMSGAMDMPIEDITIENVNICFEGGGGTSDAAHTAIQEYLDYSVIYPDVFSIPVSLPSAGLFLRHIQNAAFKNCTFNTDEFDNRPMIFAYDVKALLLQNVQIKGTCAAFTSYNSTYQLLSCSFTAEVLSHEALSRMQEGIFCSATVNTLFDHTAALADQAESMQPLITISDKLWEKDTNTWTFHFTTKKVRMLYLYFYGGLEVYLNNHKIDQISLPWFYSERLKWACHLENYLNDADNILTLVWTDPNLDSSSKTLPCGAYTPLHPGLYANAVLVG